MTLRGSVDHGFGNVGARRQGGRTIDHQDCIAVGVREQNIQRQRVSGGIGVTDDVDRITFRPGWRQRCTERRRCGGRECGKHAVSIGETVRRQHAGAAAVGENSQSFPFQDSRCRNHFGGREQVVQLGHSQDSSAAEGGAVGGVRSGQGSGVGRRRACRTGVASRLDGDDGLDASGAARGRHEFRRLCDAFHVHQDRRAFSIAREIVQQIAEIHVGHVAERYDVGEADVTPGRPVDHGGDERARLGEKRKLAGLGGAVCEAGVEPERRQQQADAVGAENAHAVRLACLENLRAQRCCDASGNDDDRAGPERG